VITTPSHTGNKKKDEFFEEKFDIAPLSGIELNVVFLFSNPINLSQ